MAIAALRQPVPLDSRALACLQPRQRFGALDEGERYLYLGDVRQVIEARCRAAAQPLSSEDRGQALRHARLGLERWRRRGLAPCGQLAEELGLSGLGLDILWLAAAPRIWCDLSDAFSALEGRSGPGQVDERLLGRLLVAEGTGPLEVSRELHPDAPLLRQGLVKLSGLDRPFANLRVSEAVLRRLTADPYDRSVEGDPIVLVEARMELSDLILAGAGIGGLAEKLAGQRGPARVGLRGAVGTGRRSLAAALAAEAGRPLGLVDVEGVRAEELATTVRERLCEVAVRGWLPLLDGLGRLVHDPSLAEALRLGMRAYGGPVLARLGPGPAGGLEELFDIFELTVPQVDARTQVWQRALAERGLDPAPAVTLAERFPIGVGETRRVVEDVGPGTPMDAGALAGRFRLRVNARLGAVATRVSELADWSALVLPPDLEESLRELVTRVGHRGLVYDRWGADRKGGSGRGVTALFQGGPGTGKTLAASVIARELGHELYRVDLSRITSKWIGETQQNLARVFDGAAGAEVVLLFDEADALFARRTEVKSSNDRHANGEVDYLLSRLDDFHGVAILTTNFGGAIDRAVLRRMTFRLLFPFPGEEERERLWRAHLPPGVPVAGHLDLASLSASFRTSGAAIRRVMLRAVFAAASKGQPLDQEQMLGVMRREYADQGLLSESSLLD
jgi:AAA+ superfamily predicted ATPase